MTGVDRETACVREWFLILSITILLTLLQYRNFQPDYDLATHTLVMSSVVVSVGVASLIVAPRSPPITKIIESVTTAKQRRELKSACRVQSVDELVPEWIAIHGILVFLMTVEVALFYPAHTHVIPLYQLWIASVPVAILHGLWWPTISIASVVEWLLYDAQSSPSPETN